MGVTLAGTDPTDGWFGDTCHSRCLERWALNDLSMGFYGTSRGRTPTESQDPLTFSALAAVGVGAIHALGTILAGGAGTLVDVKLAQVPVEAWNGGRSHVPEQGRPRQAPLPAAGPPAPLPPAPRIPAGALGFHGDGCWGP